MANEEQLSILKQGVEVWNEWTEKNLDVKNLGDMFRRLIDGLDLFYK